MATKVDAKLEEAESIVNWFTHLPRLHMPFLRIGWKRKRKKFVKIAKDMGHDLVIPADADFGYSGVLIRTLFETSMEVKE
ncbi:MAG: hypothetical protein KDC67_08840 [Ignavibacteriae bacterium]|nr:hypothetical protein [Ignavibacteriota bacterium]